jgi:hypothetical protein
MKTIFSIGAFLVFLSGNVHADIWTSAIPKEVHIIPGGMVLIGDFNMDGATCAHGAKGIILLKPDEDFAAKLSIALAAKTTKKRIQAYFKSPLASSCVLIQGVGSLPTVGNYHWQFKE